MKKDKTKFSDGEMPEGWGIASLSNLAVVNAKTIDKSFLFDEIEYIDIASVDKGRILERKRMNRSEAPSRAQRICHDNDILISTVRPSLKHFTFLQKPKPNTIASTGFAVISAKKIIPRFLYYYLTTDKYTDFLTAIADAHTSTYPAFNPDVLENSLIPVPSESEQRAIAKILSDLDEKIELNHQMDKTLESIAQAIFKRWFIDFEFPVETQNQPSPNPSPSGRWKKGEGALGYKSLGGKMVDSELGEIPDGWRVDDLGNLGVFKNGINYSREETGNAEFSIINVRDLVSNNFVLSSSLDKINIDYNKAEDYLLKEGDIVIARSASPGETIFIMGDSKNLIYSGFSIRFRANEPEMQYFLFGNLQNLKDKMSNISDGTTLKNINQETLKQIKILVPESKILFRYNIFICKLYKRIITIMSENINLINIRDSLLPKLMSGKIRLKGY